MKNILAIDIGGTKISACLVNNKGEIISEIKKYSTPKTSEKIFQILKDISYEFTNYECLAIATAGAVNSENTKVQGSTANLPEGYKEIEFSKLTNKKCFIENDANAAAWAEFKIGAAENYNNAIIVTLGTGIGGGIVINNELFRGKSGMGGEIGHIKITSYKPRKCTCGSTNCFEAYASGTGLKKTLQDFAIDDVLFKNSFLANKEISLLTTYDLIEALEKNDEFAKKVHNIWHEQLTDGLLALQNVFDTDVFVLSGSMAKYTNIELLEKNINYSSVVSDTKVKLANFENNAGMIGVALLAFKKYFS